MRDGQGNPLSAEEVAKVKAVETGKTDTSVNITSVDPKGEPKPALEGDNAERQRSAEHAAPGII